MNSIAVRLLIGLCVAGLTTGSAMAESQSLKPFEQKLASQYPGLVQITPDELASRQAAAPDQIVVIDARDPAEYAVSHVEGAIRVDANAAPDAVAKVAGAVEGKTVLFYCSVGGRSSSLASKAKAALVAKGAKEVANLSGGIFGWHNAGRPLVNAAGKTSFVHPNSQDMVRFLARGDLARMSAEPCPTC